MMTGRTGVGTVEDLQASAIKACGLDDFGTSGSHGDDHREGLGVLLESYQRDAGLTELGSKMSRFFLRGALVARLVSQASFTANPGLSSTPITRPIFVTGLPRTGTTALHRLLTADPAHQGLEMWLAEFPQPRPPRDTWAANPVFQQINAGLEQHHVENPEFMGLHYMSADDVEECWQLLRQTMMSISYESLAHLPTYSRWLDGRDWTPAYERHRRNLALIGSNEPEKRWVLKNPSHLFALDELLAVYPDALVVQTHRPPRTIIGSMCSLAASATDGWSTTFVGDTIGATQLELWSRGLQRFTEARSRHDPASFVDIDFTDLRDDPIGAVETIYTALGTPLGDEARAAMVAMDAESKSGDRKPVHRYSLQDFGLTETAVDEAFDGLVARR